MNFPLHLGGLLLGQTAQVQGWDWSPILAAVTVFILAILGALQAWVVAKITNNTQRINDVAEKVEVVHLATNSMKDELVTAVKSGALLQGAADEQQRRRDSGGGTHT